MLACPLSTFTVSRRAVLLAGRELLDEEDILGNNKDLKRETDSVNEACSTTHL